MAAPVLLVLIGGLIVTQVLSGQMLERLGVKKAITGSN